MKPCRLPWWAAALLVMASVLALGSTAWARPKIAILGLEPIGTMDPQQTEVARDLTVAFRTRASTGMFALAPNSRRELVDEKLMGNCANEALPCMAVISNNLGADYLLYGHIEKANVKGVEGYQIGLTLLKIVTKPTLTATVEEVYEEFRPAKELQGAALTRWVDAVYVSLTGERVERPNGRLIVRANAMTGVVYIDGEEKGTLANGRATIALPEGTYQVAVEADGYRRYELAGVKLAGGVTRETAVELEKRDELLPPPPRAASRKKLYLGIAGGALLVASATGGVLWYRNWTGPIADYQAMLDDGHGALDADGRQLDSERCGSGTPDPDRIVDMGTPSQPRRARAYNAACDAARAIYFDAAVTVVAGLAGIGMVAYALFSESPAEHNQTVSLAPMVTPQVSGAVLRIQW